MNDIAAERARQISKGYDASHDDLHTDGSIARAAAFYAVTASGTWPANAPLWPWEYASYQPSPARVALIKAGALIVAEIERLDRQSSAPSPPYPFCRTPEKCAGKGYCPAEIACND